MDKTALLLFTRIPVPNKVKTRLLPLLDGASCAALQKSMTLDIADTLSPLGGTLFIVHSHEGPISLLEGLPKHAQLLPQLEAPLGLRMYHAIETVHQRGFRNILLLGADLPLLTAHHVTEAMRILQQSDLVFCPSVDGGYWLVGMHTPFLPVFEEKRYGGRTVLQEALSCCFAHNLTVGLGPTLQDLDTPADLETVWNTLPKTAPPKTRTEHWLQQWKKNQP